MHDLDTDHDVLDGVVVYCPTCGDEFSPMWDYCPDHGCKLVEGIAIDGRFRLMRPLAEGAMGIVYEGLQLPIRRPVAIKVVRTDNGNHDVAAKRFLREAQMLTRIAHPNVVDVIDYGESETGDLYLVMELLRGKPLDAVLAAAGPFSVRRTCEIGVQLCDALTAAHAQGVVHRDLKPANIILLDQLGDWVKVLDFGLARPFAPDPKSMITYAGAVVGTPLYMAPEAIRCDELDARSDLYALGCVLYELLTGAAPFHGDTRGLVLMRQLSDDPPPLPESVPARLRGLITQLLAKSPADRPGSAVAARACLETCLTDELHADQVQTLTHAALPTVISLPLKPLP